MRRSIPQRETSSTGLSKPVTVRCLSLSQSLTHKKTDLSLDHLEFSALPSGLHLVDQDVMCAPPSLLLSSSQFSSSYFTKDGQHGVCVFRRRKSTEQGHRGFRLSSLGILLAKSKRPRPWRHVPALKHLAQSIESAAQLQPTGRDWDPAEAFFAARKITRSDLGGAGDWNGWSDELDVVRPLFFFFASFSHTYDYSGQGRYPQRSDYPSPSFIAHHRPLFSDSIQTRPRKTAHPHLYPASRRGRLYPLPSSRRHVLPSPDCSRP